MNYDKKGFSFGNWIVVLIVLILFFVLLLYLIPNIMERVLDAFA